MNVNFASDEAAERAQALGLLDDRAGAARLSRQKGAGRGGALTVADVDALAVDVARDGARLALNEDVALPGSVSGRRIVRLGLPSEMMLERAPTSGLFDALGFTRDGATWRYDPARALAWFVASLRELDYEWAQSPWTEPPSETTAPIAQPEVGPRPARPARDEVIVIRPGSSYQGKAPSIK
jgi:hypothetical protein